MTRIFILIMLMCLSLTGIAQKNTPKWLEKNRKAVITITTYDKDNRKINSGNGFLFRMMEQLYPVICFLKEQAGQW